MIKVGINSSTPLHFAFPYLRLKFKLHILNFNLSKFTNYKPHYKCNCFLVYNFIFKIDLKYIYS